jgi:hypothetical protein
MPTTDKQQQFMQLIQKAHGASLINWIDTPAGPAASLTNLNVVIHRPAGNVPDGGIEVSVRGKLGQPIDNFFVDKNDLSFAGISAVYSEAMGLTPSSKEKRIDSAIDELLGLTGR